MVRDGPVTSVGASPPEPGDHDDDPILPTPTLPTEGAATTPVDPADLLRRAAAGRADAYARAAISPATPPCCAAASAATACRTPTRTT